MKILLLNIIILSLAILFSMNVYAESQTRPSAATASVSISIEIKAVLSVQINNTPSGQQPDVRVYGNTPYSVHKDTQADGSILYTFSAL